MTRFREVLRLLAAHKINFIVVGGINVVLHGAPINTFDLGVVHSRDSTNVARLLVAREELAAGYRYTGGRKLKPAASRLVAKATVPQADSTGISTHRSSTLRQCRHSLEQLRIGDGGGWQTIT